MFNDKTGPMPLGRLNSGIRTALTSVESSGVNYIATPAGTSYNKKRDVLPEFPELVLPKHPYQIYYESGATAGTYLIKVYPGTTQSRDTLWINCDQNDTYLSNYPAPYKTISSGSLHKEGILYLRVQGGGSGGSYVWPINGPVKLVIQSWDGGSFNIPENDDDNLYINVGYYRSEGTGANFKITEVVNLVQTSLWTERFKCGNNPAEFFVARA